MLSPVWAAWSSSHTHRDPLPLGLGVSAEGGPHGSGSADRRAAALVDGYRRLCRRRGHCRTGQSIHLHLHPSHSDLRLLAALSAACVHAAAHVLPCSPALASALSCAQDTKSTALVAAVAEGKVDLVHALLKAGIDVDRESGLMLLPLRWLSCLPSSAPPFGALHCSAARWLCYVVCDVLSFFPPGLNSDALLVDSLSQGSTR